MFLNKFSAEQMFQTNARTNRAPESIVQYTGKIISAVEVASSHWVVVNSLPITDKSKKTDTEADILPIAMLK